MLFGWNAVEPYHLMRFYSMSGKSRATCRNCVGDDCTNNILEDITAGQILTSGYFGLVPFVSTKPPGKFICISLTITFGKFIFLLECNTWVIVQLCQSQITDIYPFQLDE